MPIRKKGNIEVKASTNKARVKQTGYTFYSYDKNAAALYFHFREQDDQPTDLSKATVRLVMILNDDNGKKFIPGDDEIEVPSAIRGTAKYVLPDNLLGYEGKVTSYVYLEFSDGSHTDEGHFTFEIKRSFITDMIPEAGDKYVKDFDDIKAEVQKTANSAIKTASEASDSIDEASKEVNTAEAEAIKNMHESDISDKNYLLDSKKKVLNPRTSGEASDNSNHTIYHLSEPIPAGVEMTISGKLEITDGAFDNISILFRDENDVSGGHSLMKISDNEFSKTFTLSKTLHKIYIYAGESDKTRGNGVVYTDVKLQTGSLATPWNPNPSEIVTQDQYDKFANAITYRNLLKGTSDEWEERTFSSWTSKDYIHLHLKDVGLQPGDAFTYSVDIDNTRDEVNADEVRSSMTFRDSEDNQLGQVATNYISGGKKERAVSTAEIPEKTSVIRVAKFNKGEGKKQKTFAIRKAMLNHGTRAAPWTPAPEDIGTKSELEKIKQAIINLGGSI